ncbi:hypothetical protein VTN49DRAFT_7654 [Thermomyces lanuginosus]|uniref:uncharacterized protein n=1 Tax=Thermomyces lanuginosus TaxID=5541 RepID=UPI00374404EF
MDFLQENLSTFLRTQTQSTTSSSSLRNIVSSILHTENLTASLLDLRTNYIDPYLIHPLSSLLSSSASTADLLPVLITLLALYISLRILDYARRVIVFWVTLFFRLVFWSAVLVFGLYAYQVGLERALTEVRWVVGVLIRFAGELMAALLREGEGRDTAGATDGWKRREYYNRYG